MKIGKLFMLLRWFFLLSFMKFKTEYNIHQYLSDHFCPEFMDKEEFDDNKKILRDLPGPAAIRYACYVGGKICGIAGAVTAVIATLIPLILFAVVISPIYKALFTADPITVFFSTSAINGVMAVTLGLVAAQMFKIVNHNKVSRSSMATIVPFALLFLFLPDMLQAASISPLVYIAIIIISGLVIAFFYGLYHKRKIAKESSSDYYLDPYSKKAKKLNDRKVRDEEEEMRRRK